MREMPFVRDPRINMRAGSSTQTIGEATGFYEMLTKIETAMTDETHRVKWSSYISNGFEGYKFLEEKIRVIKRKPVFGFSRESTKVVESGYNHLMLRPPSLSRGGKPGSFSFYVEGDIHSRRSYLALKFIVPEYTHRYRFLWGGEDTDYVIRNFEEFEGRNPVIKKLVTPKPI